MCLTVKNLLAEIINFDSFKNYQRQKYIIEKLYERKHIIFKISNYDVVNICRFRARFKIKEAMRALKHHNRISEKVLYKKCRVAMRYAEAYVKKVGASHVRPMVARKKASSAEAAIYLKKRILASTSSESDSELEFDFDDGVAGFTRLFNETSSEDERDYVDTYISICGKFQSHMASRKNEIRRLMQNKRRQLEAFEEEFTRIDRKKALIDYEIANENFMLL